MVIAIQKTYYLTMNNYKNLLIAVLTGLLGLSLFTNPAQAKAPASNPIKNAQYESCLGMSSFGGTEYLYQRENLKISDLKSFMERVVIYCAPFKPANANDSKSLEYKECLKLTPPYFYILNLTRSQGADYALFEGFNVEQVREVIRLSQDTCKTYLPK